MIYGGNNLQPFTFVLSIMPLVRHSVQKRLQSAGAWGMGSDMTKTCRWASIKGKAAEEVHERACRKSAGWGRLRWLLRFVVFPPFGSTIFLHKRQMASSEFNGWPFSSAFSPKYTQALDLVLGLLMRSMSFVLQSHWVHLKCKRCTGKTTQKFSLPWFSSSSSAAASSSLSFLTQLHYFAAAPVWR